MAKTISDLNSVISLEDENLMIVRQGTVDRKTSMSQIIDYIKSEPITFADDITVSGTFSLGTNQKTAFNRDFGTIAGTVSEGNHTHSTYVSANSTVSTSSPITIIGTSSNDIPLKLKGNAIIDGVGYPSLWLESSVSDYPGILFTGTTPGWKASLRMAAGTLRFDSYHDGSWSTSLFLVDNIGNSTIAGTLTVNGTGTSTINGLVSFPGSTSFASVPTITSGTVKLVTCMSGTAFPASPGLGDECYRTDLDEWYKYNGSIWMQI